jgi:hypothetical protein
MGQLMALALVCTMMAAVLFQPVLMGPPQGIAAPSPSGWRTIPGPDRLLSPVAVRRGQ